MTHMTRDDFARLLARARTVIADAAPTAHSLCAELAQIERLLREADGVVAQGFISRTRDD